MNALEFTGQGPSYEIERWPDTETRFNQVMMKRGLSMFQFWGKERCNEDAQHKSMFEI